LVVVFVEGDVSDPVQRLNTPVLAGPFTASAPATGGCWLCASSGWSLSSGLGIGRFSAVHPSPPPRIGYQRQQLQQPAALAGLDT
jgi:hypothetical protein